MLQRRGHRQEGAIEDHAQHAVPIGQSHLAERLFRPAGGIVDQDVEAPKARDGGGDQALDGGLIADIGQDRQRLATERGDLASNGIDRALIAPAIDHHGCSRRGQHQSDGPADIAASAGD
jgi:hypothetical protein